MDLVPAALPGTALRVLATTDLAAELVPRRVSWGQSGTCAGVVELLERERGRQPTVWVDAGDFTVGPAAALLGRRPWEDIAELPIDAAAAGNHEFDDGVPALLEAARVLPFPLLCANADLGLPGTAMVETPAGGLGVIGLTHPHVDRLTEAPQPSDNGAEADSVLVVDLPDDNGTRAAVRGWFRVPAVRPQRATTAIGALDAAAANVLGESRHSWVSRTGAERYLPDLIAAALRQAAGTDAGMVMAAQHLTQGSLDGVTAMLRAGPVTELDLLWLFGVVDDRPAVVELRPGELAAAVARHDAIADPGARGADRVWWNWSRMPAGISAGNGEPATVAVVPWVVPRLAELLGRDLAADPATGGARAALLRVLS